MTKLTVCLGASAGIGLAFAEHFAREGHELIVVARNKSALLDVIAGDLVSLGASSVNPVEANLLDLPALGTLLDRVIGTASITNLFIGGPGPISGAIGTLEDDQVVTSYKACIEYPVVVLQALRESLHPSSQVYVLSSSATRESLWGHQFFLSALLRRPQAELLREVTASFPKGAPKLRFLEPHVVLSNLSLAYGQRLAGSESREAAVDALRREFSLTVIPDAAEFVADSIVRITSD